MCVVKNRVQIYATVLKLIIEVCRGINMNQNEEWTEDEHFVPVFYLENFRFNGNKLWVYDLIRNKVYSQSPRNICHKKNAYEVQISGGEFIDRNEIEKHFSNLEGNWTSVIRNILRKCSEKEFGQAVLTECEINELKMLTVNLIIRNPYGYRKLVDYLETNGLGKAFDFIMDNFDVPEKESDVKQIIKRKVLMDLILKDDRTTKKIADEWLKLNYCTIGYSEERLMTTDNPVIIKKEAAGWLCILPISLNYALVWRPECNITENRKMYRIQPKVVEAMKDFYMGADGYIEKIICGTETQIREISDQVRKHIH